VPDKYGFNHLPDRGRISHRCIEEGCGWPEQDVFVSESDRKRHHQAHIRPRQKEIEKTRLQNLAKARKARQKGAA